MPAEKGLTINLLSNRIFVALALTFAAVTAVAQTPIVEYYVEIGCAHCDTFKSRTLPAAEQATGVQVVLELYDVLSTDGYNRCESRLADMGYKFRGFPVLIIGNNASQVNSAIEKQLQPELLYYAEHGEFRARLPMPSETDVPRSSTMRWAALPIFLAGLVDGINPCAFTTLLFFMSYLGLRGGGKRRMAFAGLAFAAGVFVSYFLLGLGLFNVLRLGDRLVALRLALRLVVSGITVMFCALSIRDIILFRKGNSAAMALKLPDALRERINRSVRQGVRSTAFFSALVSTGAVVALLELACTGQVYFPAIAIMVQTDASWLGVGSLLLYNFAFITPLLVVLILALLGAGQESIRVYFIKHIVLSKVLVAALFAVLAIAIWLF